MELGAAVDLVGGFAIFFAEGVDQFGGELGADFELWILLVDARSHGLWHRLAISLPGETFDGYTCLDEVVDDALGATVGEVDVILLGADTVGVRTHLEGHIGVVFEHLCQFVESLLRFGAECGAVEVVEDILHHLRLMDSGEDKIDAIIGILLFGVGLKFLFYIEISLSTGEHHILHAALEREFERAVIASHLLLGGAIIADDTNHGIWHRFFILIEHISGDGDLDIGFDKAVDMVITSAVATVRAEETRFTLTEGDAEVIALAIHGGAEIFDAPAVAGGVQARHEDIEATETGMAIA